jgi:uncharacterized membrane protein YeaQ/YmgE (transglycosylase-associated protein family)
MNTSLKIVLTALLAAIGIALRTIAIPIFSNVQLTPGMIAPILCGMLLGLWPGITTGFIIGLYAGLVSGEFILIPLIGNICLGLAPGIITEINNKTDEKIRAFLYTITSGLIGGFLPTFGISLWLIPNLYLASIYGIFDLANAIIAAIIALVIWKILIRKFEEFKQ